MPKRRKIRPSCKRIVSPLGIDITETADSTPAAPHPAQTIARAARRISGRPIADLSEGRVDFWWDEYSGNTGNCWHDNVGQNGTARSITSLPPSPPPGAAVNTPHFLPHICDDTSVGSGGPAQESELGNCLANFSTDPSPGTCPWFTKPSDPSP